LSADAEIHAGVDDNPAMLRIDMCQPTDDGVCRAWFGGRPPIERGGARMAEASGPMWNCGGEPLTARIADTIARNEMKYGAVCSPGFTTNPSNVYVQADLLYRMRATTARISMYFDSPYTRRYSDQDLDILRGAGLTEMIIQSSETPDPDLAYNQLEWVRPYIQLHREILFIFELGNEPDVNGDEAGNPGLAHWRRLTYLKDKRPLQREPNLLFAVNMLSQDNDNAAYFNDFVRDWNEGLGPLLTGPNQPDLVTVHCYNADRLCPMPQETIHNPYKMIDWVRGWTTSLNIKVTEAGISNTDLGNTGPYSRSWRYVEFAEEVGPNTGGQVDSVCFYGLPIVGSGYDIDGPFADEIGTRQRTFLC
jgi:hypothetical protein